MDFRDMILVTGDTTQFKSGIKNLGGIWLPDLKGWMVEKKFQPAIQNLKASSFPVEEEELIKGLSYKQIATSLVIVGNSYNYKEKLKEMGAKWDMDIKSWKFTATKKAELEKNGIFPSL